MENKILLTPKQILDQKFQKDVKGYSADEVDLFLDQVISDYQAFSDINLELNKQIEALVQENVTLKNNLETSKVNEQKYYHKMRDLEIENTSLHNKFDLIQPGDRPTNENLQYIKRIRAYEQYLYSQGVDPEKIIKNT